MAGFQPLFRVGSGSTLSAYEVADIALSERFGSLIDGWVAVVVFVLPLCGAGLLASQLASGGARAVRWTLAALGTAAVVGMALGGADGEIDRLGPAIWIAVTGAVAAVAALALVEIGHQ